MSAYFLQSSEPSLQVDHIAYWKSADQIIEQFPNGDYWRSMSPVKNYAVLLAYLYRITSDHIVSLKLILLVTTILYLLAFELFLSSFVREKGFRVLFSLLSAFYVSYGHSFWGFTAFSASLNRSIVIPFIVVLMWFFFRYEDKDRKYLVLPALVYLSLLHLSSYYVFVIFVLYEFLCLLLFRRRAFSKRIVGLLSGLVLSWLAYVHLKLFGLSGPTVGNFLAAARILVPGQECDVLSGEETWAIELFAQPWRNFPVPMATVLGTLASQTFIWILSGFGLWKKMSEKLDAWDRRMLLFGFCIVVCAVGPQFVIWILRRWFSIYPINFEEIRAISFLFLPLYYFVIQLILHTWRSVDISKKALALFVVISVFLIQPVYLFQMSPRSFRQWTYDFAVKSRILEDWDSQRSVYAKQVLGLDIDGGRYYYDLRNVIRWLELNTDAGDVVLTNRDELYLLRATTIGNTVGFLTCQTLFSIDRREWSEQVLEYARALSARDLKAIRRLAEKYHAKYAVVPWMVPTAEYSDRIYSVVSTAPQT
ncbi:MAG: hypothetical protein L7F78_04425 [Syntrophales bacterium LBB04]|nr:hypothetical protein [Syntrophales bacterium LBB04]